MGKGATVPRTFWFKPFSNFGLSIFTMFTQQFTYVVLTQLALAPYRLVAGSVGLSSRFGLRGNTPWVLLPAASHRWITPPACAGGLCQLNDKFLSEQLFQATSCRTSIYIMEAKLTLAVDQFFGSRPLHSIYPGHVPKPSVSRGGTYSVEGPYISNHLSGHSPVFKGKS